VASDVSGTKPEKHGMFTLVERYEEKERIPGLEPLSEIEFEYVDDKIYRF
jgi:hypothetical protein